MTGLWNLRRVAIFAVCAFGFALTAAVAPALAAAAEPALAAAAEPALAAAAEPLVPCGAGDEVEFCRLTPEDFRAKTKPEDFGHRVEGFDAVSCIRVRWPELEPVYTESPGKLTKVVYENVRFFAAFDRNCSFWGGEAPDPELALQHQQLHFAIVEYAARDLSSDRPQGMVRAYGKTREAALQNLQIRMGRIAENGFENAQRQSAAFDALVRARPTLATQQKWLERYRDLLGIEF